MANQDNDKAALVRETEATAERFNTLADAAFEAVVIHVDGVIVDLNRAGAEMLHSTPEQVVGRPIVDFLAPDELERVLAHVQAGREDVYEAEFLRTDGTQFTGEVRGRNAEYLGRKARVAVVRDVSEARRAEAERREFETRALNAERLEQLGLLAGGVAHDFNNILVGILGNADLLLSELPSDSPLAPRVEEIKRSARTASELTDQMLAYSGKGSFILRSVGLNQIVEGAVRSLDADRRAAVSVRLSDDAPMIAADARQARGLVRQLLENALESSAERPEVTIETGVLVADQSYFDRTHLQPQLPAGEYGYLYVSDRGDGMDDTAQRRIFEPFFTTKPASRGLGLAAALGIVRAHGGTIEVESAVGEGTRVRILLPVAASAPEEAPNVPVREAPGGTVLVVDDDPAVRQVAGAILRRAGFEVLTAADGESALEAVEGDARLDLVLLDVTMPGMSGPEASERMRVLRPDLPVLLSSGFDRDQLTRDVIDAEGVAFIQKPYEMSTLLDAVRKAIG